MNTVIDNQIVDWQDSTNIKLATSIKINIVTMRKGNKNGNT